MQIPEYVRRELSEVYLLMDHIAGRPDKKLEQALAASTPGGVPITLKDVCAVAWPPTDQNRAETLALVLTAKDRLSHAAWPATAYSVAFTYLSVIPHSNTSPKNLRQRISAYVRRRLARGPHGRGSVLSAPLTNAGNQDAPNGREEREEIDEATTTSTMVQFANDAFPGLDTQRERLVGTMFGLGCVLAVLLTLTCLVSWDLAIGQRLIADFKWLSTHPDVMQIDPDQPANSPCPKVQTGLDQEPPANRARTDASKGGEATGDPDEIPQGGRCARYLAGTRVLPMMERWITDQVLLAWSIDGGPFSPEKCRTFRSDPPTPEEDLKCQGYFLELQRVLVTTLNYDVLPLLLGALAATAAALREIAGKTAENELEPRYLSQAWFRILLGAFLGAVIGLLVSRGASNGLFALAKMSSGIDQTGDTVALSPAVYAFFAGFATGRIFNWLDNLLEKILPLGNPKP